MIPFSPPRMDNKIIDAVIDTLNSGWITTGPKTKRFETKITEFCGCRKTLCVSSGSGGMELMLRWFGVGPGDEVIIPAYTYTATANVVVHTGAKPVMVDVGDDFNIDVNKIAEAITPRTKVIMPVDIAGWPADYDEINALVNKPDIKTLFNPATAEQKLLGRILVLSDAAHSLGAVYKGKKTGSLADITVFSFHAVKNLTTAEGGAVAINLPEVFDVEEVYKNLNIKSLHGQSKDALSKTKIGNWRYDVLEAGYKFNMTDIQAAMGLVELERYQHDMLSKRKHIFDLYKSLLGRTGWAELPVYENETKRSSYHVFLLRIKNAGEKERDEIIREIFEKEVAVNVHFIPLPLLTFYRNSGYDISDYPEAYSHFSNEISLPVYYDLSDDDVRTVVNAVSESVKKVMKYD